MPLSGSHELIITLTVCNRIDWEQLVLLVNRNNSLRATYSRGQSPSESSAVKYEIKNTLLCNTTAGMLV